MEVVIDVDLANFFGTIDHDILKDLLGTKIKDTKFMRYISRMLKAGILAEGELQMSDEEVPQGSCCSPITKLKQLELIISEITDYLF